MVGNDEVNGTSEGMHVGRVRFCLMQNYVFRKQPICRNAGLNLFRKAF
jgi:hypothetical protein